MTKALHLRAEDGEDLKILSAHLQDAVGQVGDLAFLPQQRRFALVLNRFQWEKADADGAFTRVRTGLHFGGILKAKSRGLRRDAPDGVFELLAIEFQPTNDGAGEIAIILAGGGEIRLEAECIEAELHDLSEPWPTAHKPQHEGGA
ncbi:MAG: DUF2948 family protein [Alphaproteobacteria bacterium]|nr:DUF2948 family protein [Alphaproteobacteria bacterium]